MSCERGEREVDMGNVGALVGRCPAELRGENHGGALLCDFWWCSLL